MTDGLVVTPAAEDDPVGPSERTGLLTVRVWLHDHALIARVTLTPDLEGESSGEHLVTSGQEVQHLVAEWLAMVQAE